MDSRILLCGPLSAKAVTGITLAFDLQIKGSEDRLIQCKVTDEFVKTIEGV